MMAKRFSKKVSSSKIASSGRDFTEMIRAVPVHHFVKMVSKCGMPAPEARELCAAFRELKA